MDGFYKLRNSAYESSLNTDLMLVLGVQFNLHNKVVTIFLLWHTKAKDAAILIILFVFGEREIEATIRNRLYTRLFTHLEMK